LPYIDVPSSIDEMIEYIKRLRSERVAGSGLPFAIYDIVTSPIVGVSCYLNVEWRAEIGGAGCDSSPRCVVRRRAPGTPADGCWGHA